MTLALALGVARVQGAGWQYTLQVLKEDGNPWHEGGWVLGSQESATDGFDQGIDGLAPPAKPDGTRIWLEVGTGASELEKLQRDKRALTAPSPQWKLRLGMPGQCTWRIGWTPGGIPPAVTAMTIHPADANWQPSGAAVDMTQQASLDVVNSSPDLAAKRFLIGVTTEGPICVDSRNRTGVQDGSMRRPFRTIQGGINAAVDGGTVKVARSTYAENVTISGKTVAIFGGYLGGTDYAATDGNFGEANRDPDPSTNQTVIDGGGAGVVVECQGAAARGSVLTGFQLREGGATLRGGVVLRRVILEGR